LATAQTEQRARGKLTVSEPADATDEATALHIKAARDLMSEMLNQEGAPTFRVIRCGKTDGTMPRRDSRTTPERSGSEGCRGTPIAEENES
jgi:hypothetical protein